MLKLEAGKRYWMRYGGVSGVLRLNRDATNPFTDGAWTWAQDGKRFIDDSSEADLVREYTEPQPLEWKRGIPTEEECRECWLIVGGDGERPFRVGAHCHGPDATKQRHWKQTDWYLALKVKPVEPPKPKTRTVTLRKWVDPNGTGEYQMIRDDLFRKPSGYTKTDETRTVEVPCE